MHVFINRMKITEIKDSGMTYFSESAAYNDVKYIHIDAYFGGLHRRIIMFEKL